MQEEFDAYLKCGRLEHGFLRVRCADCHAEKLVAFSCKRRGFCPSCGARLGCAGWHLPAPDVLARAELIEDVGEAPLLCDRLSTDVTSR